MTLFKREKRIKKMTKKLAKSLKLNLLIKTANYKIHFVRSTRIPLQF